MPERTRTDSTIEKQLGSVVEWEIWNNIGKDKAGTIKKPKNCSVKRSEISIETQGQRRRKAGQEAEQRPWLGVPKPWEEKQRVGCKRADTAGSEGRKTETTTLTRNQRWR